MDNMPLYTYTLPEGKFIANANHKLMPIPEEGQIPQQGMIISIQPFIIRREHDIVLLDTGIGYVNEKGIPMIYANLKRHNIGPEQVTRILISHLHADHIGGICFKNQHGNYEIAFPNALYHINKKSFENMVQDPKTDKTIKEKLFALEASGNIAFITESQGGIGKHISFIETHGHCFHHLSFKIIVNNEVVYFGGDEAPQLYSLRTKIMARYDHDSKTAAQLRSQWWKIAQEEKWTFLLYHDNHYPIYKVQ